MTDIPTLITAFTTLFVIIDPPGLAPLFLALTHGMSPARRRRLGLRACGVAGGLMLIFIFLGEAVLNFVGISMPAFRIAGGVLLFLTALDMLFQRRQQRRRDNAAEAEQDHHDDPSVFPLAIPLIVGPGAITTLILLTSQAGGTADFAAIIAIAAAILLLVLITFLGAPFLERVLGRTGINVVTRLLGILLAALSVQFILDGLRDFGFAA